MSGSISQSARCHAKGRVLWTGDRPVRLQVKFHDQMPTGRQMAGKILDQVKVDVVDHDDHVKRTRHTVTGIEIAPCPFCG